MNKVYMTYKKGLEELFESAKKKYRLFELTDPEEFEKRVFIEVCTRKQQMIDTLLWNYSTVKAIGYKKDCSVYEEVQSEPSAETNGGQGVTSTDKSDT